MSATNPEQEIPSVSKPSFIDELAEGLAPFKLDHKEYADTSENATVLALILGDEELSEIPLGAYLGLSRLHERVEALRADPAIESDSDLGAVKWYVDCLREVAFGKNPVRGLAEAEGGYRAAMSRLAAREGNEGS